MIENMKEDILCTRFTGKELNVIYDENVQKLIKMNKIVSRIFLYRLNVLLSEFFCSDVQNCFILIFFFDFNPNCMGIHNGFGPQL